MTDSRADCPLPEAPETRPRLILLHGTRLNGAQWAAYGPALASVAEVVAPDLPGHGQRAGEPFSLARTVADVAALADKAGARPVLLGGHSLGGYAAMCYAQRYPRRLAGLALIGCAAEPRGAGAWLYRQVARLWEAAGPEGMARLEQLYFSRTAHAPTWAAVQAHGGQFRQIRAAWGEVMRQCSARQLRHVSCPVLVMGGGWDQLHIHARRFAAAAPCGQVFTQPRRGHLWPLTHPAEVAAALRRWIERLPLSPASDPP